MRAALLLRVSACCAVALLTLGPAARGDDNLEYAVKAAYLAKFVPFIDWPSNAFATPGAPINICVLGQDPFGVLLDHAAAAMDPGGGRPLAVRRLSSPELAAACQILYLGKDSNGDVLAALKDRPVVTVTDAGPQGGVVGFITIDNHVRFDIDDDAAERSGVHISSKLLTLAHAVKRKETP